MKELLLLLAGVPVGVVANYAYQYARSRTDRMFDPIKMTGKWGELVSDSSERRCSMGEIRHDQRRNMWTFDGTNYHDDGRPFCHWTTEVSYLDKTAREFYYIFTNTLVESGQKGYIGFGVVRFRRQEEAWVPDHGFFMSGNEGDVQVAQHGSLGRDSDGSERDSGVISLKTWTKLNQEHFGHEQRRRSGVRQVRMEVAARPAGQRRARGNGPSVPTSTTRFSPRSDRETRGQLCT